MDPEVRALPRLSVVIVTWNSAAHIGDCLAAVDASGYPGEVERIVVDNASADDTVAVVQPIDDVVLVETGRNAGFAGGCNAGIARATGEVVMLLNPDARVTPGSLATLVEALRAEPTTGMCGPLLVGGEGAPERGSARLGPNLAYDLLHHGLRLGRRPGLAARLARRWQYPYDLGVSQPVEAISGAAMAMRADALEEVGGLDEGYRHCGEDLDLCLRFRRAGWEVRYVAGATVRHVGGASSARAPHRTVVESMLGRERYYRKNRSVAQARGFRAILCTVRAPAVVLGGLARVRRAGGTEELRQRVRVAGCLVLLRPFSEPG